MLRNLPLRLVLFTGQLQGGLCPSLILIVKSLTLIGRLPTVFSTLLSVFLLLVCRSFRFRGVQPGTVSVIESVKGTCEVQLTSFSSVSSLLDVDVISIVNEVRVV